jgi:hypothetical protein
MKREMKGGLPAWEMGDEVLGSIPGASPLGANVGLNKLMGPGQVIARR